MSKNSENIEPPSNNPKVLSWFTKKMINLFSRKTEISISEEEAPESNQLEIKNEEFKSSLDNFMDKTVEDVMIPRSDIIAVSADIELSKLCKVIVEQSHTRTLVYKENLDNIIGFVHIKDLFELLVESEKFNMKKLLRKHLVTTHSMKLVELLTEMKSTRTHIAVVVDEYGGTDGIVTSEDLMEAIVGRIDDEHDELDTESFKLIKPGVVLTSARVEVEELEKTLNINLKREDDEFDTIGGLVLAKVGHVPQIGDIITISDEIVVEVIDSTPRTIKQLKITLNAKDTDH